ncbi:MAG TPA: GNAT family protein [Patescibacteria group bacterium]|nr:GNAT family protein [Patescibacteria group bacterium]
MANPEILVGGDEPRGRSPDSPPLPPEPPLADEVVLLRLPCAADVDAIAAACADPEIARWIPVPVPYSRSDARAFLDEAAAGWSAGTDLTFVIEERASATLAGMIDLRRGDAPGRASVGYWLAPGGRGRGLATRAVRLVAAWAFADRTLQRLELLTMVGNDPSGRVALRAGFRRGGILRQYLPFRGRAVDAVMYSIGRDDGDGTAGEGPAADAPAGV